MGLVWRGAVEADAADIARIWNEGIVDRTSTFETEPRTTARIAAWMREKLAGKWRI